MCEHVVPHTTETEQSVRILYYRTVKCIFFNRIALGVKTFNAQCYQNQYETSFQVDRHTHKNKLHQQGALCLHECHKFA